MTDLRVFPDIEEFLIGHLTDQLPDVYACSILPSDPTFTTSLPLVQVTRIGGIPVYRRQLDEPTVSLDVYASSRQQANEVVGRVRAVVAAMTDVTREGGRVTQTDEATGPTLRPEEPNTNVVRIGLTVSLIVRPA